MFATGERPAPPDGTDTIRGATAPGPAGAARGASSPAGEAVAARGASSPAGEAEALADWLGEVATRLRAVDPSGWPRRDLVEVLAALARLTSAATACEARVTNAVDRLRDRGIDAADVLRQVTGRSRRTARRHQRRAHTLDAMPRVADAFGHGRLATETLDALTSAADRVDPALVDADEYLLSSVSDLPADRARRIIDDWVADHESAGEARRRLERQRQRREARWWTDRTDGMTHLHARLDPVTAAPVIAALDAEVDRLWRHDGGREGRPDEVRTPDRRRADAVCRLLGAASPHPDDPPVPTPATAGARIVVTVDLAALADGADGTCHIVDTGPVPVGVLAHIARAHPETTTIQAALFDGPGRPLWLGRSHRLATADQRLLLAVRDGGCTSCDAPTTHCHAHHDPPWNAGGRTDLDALTLLCSTCHGRAHRSPPVGRGP